MNHKSDILVQVFDSWVKSLSDRLQPVLKDSHSIGKIRNGTQKGFQDIYGFVSFSPRLNPEEENIDANLSINVREESAKISADICWSDGDMISNFGEYQIEYSSLDELFEKIKRTCPQIEEKMFQRMTELIKSDLPPKYRHG